MKNIKSKWENMPACYSPNSFLASVCDKREWESSEASHTRKYKSNVLTLVKSVVAWSCEESIDRQIFRSGRKIKMSERRPLLMARPDAQDDDEEEVDEIVLVSCIKEFSIRKRCSLH